MRPYWPELLFHIHDVSGKSVESEQTENQCKHSLKSLGR